MVNQELRTENHEGMAEYIGLKALRLINAEKFSAVVAGCLAKLREESSLLFDIRRISYFSGAIYFLCLEELGYSVRNDMRSELTCYEQTRIDTYGVTAVINDYDFVAANHDRLIAERINTISDHIHRSEYTESSSVICGYDPMNMFRVGHMIYCSHFVYLMENSEPKPIFSPVVVRLAEGSDKKVVGYYA